MHYVVLMCLGLSSQARFPQAFKGENLIVSVGACNFDGMIPRCCRFLKRPRVATPIAPYRSLMAEPGQLKSLGTDAFIAFRFSLALFAFETFELICDRGVRSRQKKYLLYFSSC